MSDHTLFKEVKYDVGKLLADIEMGEIALPELQRPFVWKKSKIRDLFDSMYQGYPVGYLLLWANDDPQKVRTIGEDSKQRIPHLLVIDGQQRLTSLYAVIKGRPVRTKDFEDVQVEIAFHPLEERFEVADAAIRRDPTWISSITELWKKDSDIFEFVDAYLQRLEDSTQVSNETRKRIRRSVQRLESIRTYPFTALELSGVLDEERVAEVFVRVNSKGKALNQADFILTLMSVHWEEGRRQLEEFCAKSRRIPAAHDEPSSWNPFIKPDPDDLLRVSIGLGFRRARLRYAYLILHGKDLETEKFIPELRDKQFGVLRQAQAKVLHLSYWLEYFKALLKAGVRGEHMITSRATVMYAYCMYLIGKCDFGIDEHRLRQVIARWYFFASLTGRYTGSPESAMASDLTGLRNLQTREAFLGRLDQIMELYLTEDYWRTALPEAMATSSARTPALFAYYSALNLLDAKVLFSDLRASDLLDPYQKPRKKALDRHHLFPKGYLKRLGVTERREVNQIGNMALVEWPDNIAISDKAPGDYFPGLMNRYSTEEAKNICFWHGLPEGWIDMPYPQFLDARRKALAAMIRAGFEHIGSNT